MIDTCEMYAVETSEVPPSTQPFSNEQDITSHRFRDRSYLGMRLWVFVSQAQKEQTLFGSDAPSHLHVRDEHRPLPTPGRRDTTNEHEPRLAKEDWDKAETLHSLSIVLPAYNEEAVIGATLEHVLNVLAAWVKDLKLQ